MASIWDLIVRVAGDSNQFREDIAQDKASMDDLMMTIHDKDLSINVNAQEADAKIEAIRVRLQEIKDTAALIRVDDARAREKVDEFRIKLDEVIGKTADINISDADAEKKLEKLKIQLDELKMDRARIPITVEDGDAFEKIEAIRLDLDELHDKRVEVTVDEKGNVNRFSQDTQQAGQQWAWLAGTIMTTLPLLSPLVASAAYMVGGMATSFGVAATGVAGFAAVAKSNISAVTAEQQKLKAAQDAVNQAQQQLGAAKTYQQWLVATENLQTAHQGLAQAQAGVNGQMMQAVNALNSFESFWKSYTESFRPGVLSAFTDGLNVLRSILTDLRPTITAAGQAIGELLNGANNALKGSEMQNFFSMLAYSVGPAVLAWGQAFGNVFRGVADLMVAFSPTLDSMNGGLVNMTASFANWANGLQSSQSFHDFLNYAATNGPLVARLLGQLGSAITNILVAMAPSGHLILQLVTGLLQLVNAILTVNPVVGHFGAAILGGFGVMNLVSPLFASAGLSITKFAEKAGEDVGFFGKALTALGGPWGWIIAAVVAGVILIITHWQQIQAVTTTVWNAILGVIRSVWAEIGPTIMSAVNAIASFWRSIWPQLQQIFTGVWNIMKGFLAPIFALWRAEFSLIFTVLKAMWDPFWNMLLDVLKLVWDNIRGVIQITWDIITGIFKVALDLLTGQWGKAWLDMKDMLSKVWTDITTMFGNMEKDALQFGENFVKMIGQGISAGIHWVEDAAKNVATAIEHFVGFKSPTRGGPGATADRWMPNLISMLVDGLNEGIPQVHSALSRVIVPPNVAAMANGTLGSVYGGAAGAGHTFQITIQNNAPIYGVDDLQSAIKDGVEKHALPTILKAVQPTARAMGVSR